MPHIHLSVAGLVPPFEVGQVLQDLVNAFGEVETVDPASLKAYFTRHEEVIFGAGHFPAMVHVTASVLSGRPLVLRKRMASTIHGVLLAHFEQSGAKITVEIREMDRESYIK